MKRTPIKSRKSKRLSDYDSRFENMKPLVLERSGGRCEVGMLPPRFDVVLSDALCDQWNTMILHTAQATHVHHRKYRARGGTNQLSNLLHVCGPCHSWIHANGGFGQPANVLGLALSANESEEL